MEKFYILDTCSFYSYCLKYLSIFTDKTLSLTEDSLTELYAAFNNNDNNIKIIIPSVIFIEIFDHYFNNEEFVNKFKYEVYTRIISDESNSKIAIIDIDEEILENLSYCYTDRINVDLHDKLIIATALKYQDKNTTLYTSDQRIKKIQRTNSLNIRIKD